MTLEFFLYLMAGAVACGFINGLAGFGTALFSLGWWLAIMPPREAVAAVLFMTIASGIQGTLLVRRSIRWPRLARFALPAVLGIPVGLQLLDIVDPSALKRTIAAFLILYGGFFAFRKRLPNFTRPTHSIDAAIGFVSGILGALAGLSGALPTMWCALRPWPKSEQRAVLQPFSMIVLTLSAVALAFDGAYRGAVLVDLAMAMPFSLLSARAGVLVFERLRDDQFRRLLVFLMLAAGLILMARETLGVWSIRT